VAAIRLSWLAELCEKHPKTIRLKLEDLRDRGWIDFEKPRPGQHIAWKIWLTGLVVVFDSTAPAQRQLSASSTKHLPPAFSSSSTGQSGEVDAIPLGDSDNSPSPAQHASSAPATNETRPDQTRTKSEQLSEGKLDHVLGKTTAPDENGVSGGRLLSDEELTKMAQAETRRRHEAGEF